MDAKFATRGQERELLAWIVRNFPEGQLPAGQAQYLIDHPEKLPELLLVMVASGTVTTPAALTAVVSQWQKFFGHLRVWDPDFNEAHFPLGADPGDEAEEGGLDHLVSGHEAVAEFAALQRPRQGASLWAQGRYINKHPDAQKAHPLVGIGAQWQDRVGLVFFPLFHWVDGEPGVNLFSLGREFGPDCRFLLRKEQGG